MGITVKMDGIRCNDRIANAIFPDHVHLVVNPSALLALQLLIHDFLRLRERRDLPCTSTSIMWHICP